MTDVQNRIAKAMLTLDGKLDGGYLKKDGKNTHANYQYSTADNVYDATREALAKEGLSIYQSEVSMSFETVRTRSGETTLILIAYDIGIQTEDGKPPETLERCTGSATFNGPQSLAACRTYAMKYYLRGKLLIPTGDPETDAEDGQGGHQAPRYETDSDGNKRPQKGPQRTRVQRPKPKPQPPTKQQEDHGVCPDHFYLKKRNGDPQNWFKSGAMRSPAHPIADDIDPKTGKEAWCYKNSYMKRATKVVNILKEVGINIQTEMPDYIMAVIGRTFEGPPQANVTSNEWELVKQAAQATVDDSYQPNEEQRA